MNPGLTLPGDDSALTFSLVFAVALCLSVALRLWLCTRQIRHVARHRDQVPEAFAERISLQAHQRAAAYTVGRVRLSMIEAMTHAAWLIVLTMLGGLQWLMAASAFVLPESWDAWRGALLLVIVLMLGGLIDLPFDWWRQFHLEERFGFNRMTPRLFVADLGRSLLLGALLGLPLLAAVLTVMGHSGSNWWLWTWFIWTGFNVMVLLIFPGFIAPLFNRFEPLPEGAVRQRVEALLARTGFAARGLFVMDGSKRSAHGNAYFTGFGAARRIVFYDTLIQQLNPDEIEAVLAHELGHFRLHHLRRRLITMVGGSFLMLALLGWLSAQPWFHAGLGMTPDLALRDAATLLGFLLAAPVFLSLLAPLASWLSRRDEFAADAFAARLTQPQALIDALLKLYRDNAATLTPDPLYSAVHDSHPPAPQRIGHLQSILRG